LGTDRTTLGPDLEKGELHEEACDLSPLLRGYPTARHVGLPSAARQWPSRRTFYGKQLFLLSERRLQLQNSAKGDAGFSNQGGAFHFGSSIGVKPRETAGYLSASKRKVHSDRLSMLVRDQFTTPLAVLERVRARIVEIRVATSNAAVAQNNYASGMASFSVSHFNAYGIQPVLYFHNLGARSG
jgi:hypothetical protein